MGTILGADLYTALRLSKAEGAHVTAGSDSAGAGADHDTGGRSTRVKSAITVIGTEKDVRRAFREFDWQAFDPAGEITFTPAPGDRGTEVHLDHDPGGNVLRKLTGRAPDQQINDDLRRFKALVETGVEPRSDKTPEGFSARGQMTQRPAQPVSS